MASEKMNRSPVTWVRMASFFRKGLNGNVLRPGRPRGSAVDNMFLAGRA